MLKAKAEIQFTIDGRVFNKKYFRPTFNFGNNLLFSGNLISDEDIYLYSHQYIVDIDFFTIEDDAFNVVSPILKFGMDLAIQEGAHKIVGNAKLLDFQYEPPKDDLAVVERLLSAERSRIQGIKGYSINKFEQNMRAVIKKGAAHGLKQ